MERGSMCGMMGPSSMESGNAIKYVAKYLFTFYKIIYRVYMFGQMVVHTMVNGRATTCMVRVCMFGRMAVGMKESI